MIQLNELRIGNYVSVKTNKYNVDVAKVYSLEKGVRTNYPYSYENVGCTFLNNMAGHPDIYNIYGCESIEPITLTKEILEKLGCECVKTDYLYIFIISSDSLSKVSNCIKIYFYLYNGVVTQQNLLQQGDTLPTSIARINYLHQLQNLYFVLAGKELEVKL